MLIVQRQRRRLLSSTPLFTQLTESPQPCTIHFQTGAHDLRADAERAGGGPARRVRGGSQHQAGRAVRGFRALQLGSGPAQTAADLHAAQHGRGPHAPGPRAQLSVLIMAQSASAVIAANISRQTYFGICDPMRENIANMVS